MTLREKRVLITGGASGIGLAIAKRAVEEGSRIVVADIAHNSQAPVEWHTVDVDVAVESRVREMVRKTIEHLGGLDVLIHCAGIGIQQDLLQTELSDWRRVIDINLTGTFLCCREAARVMAPQRHGCIVTIGSSSAARPGIRSSAYAASKAGAVNFTRAIAIDLAKHGIRVNAVSPGPIDTDLASRRIRLISDRILRRSFLKAVTDAQTRSRLQRFFLPRMKQASLPARSLPSTEDLQVRAS